MAQTHELLFVVITGSYCVPKWIGLQFLGCLVQPSKTLDIEPSGSKYQIICIMKYGIIKVLKCTTLASIFACLILHIQSNFIFCLYLESDRPCSLESQQFSLCVMCFATMHQLNQEIVRTKTPSFPKNILRTETHSWHWYQKKSQPQVLLTPVSSS